MSPTGFSSSICSARAALKSAMPVDDSPASSMLPEFLRCDASAFGHRRHLGPYDIRIDRRLPDPGAEAAVASGHHVFPSDEPRVAADALRDELGMLDEVGLRFDDPRDENLALRQLDLFEQRPLVRMTRIRGLDCDRGGTRTEGDVDHVGQRDVAVMRTFVVAPA